jgi:nitroimidazol reductase NimA-like FMN-containing flavoprotein (pyridoxamine 5'-phosphate oxidase superfamily)
MAELVQGEMLTRAIHELTPGECWTLLASGSLGRIGVALDSGVDIFPVNYLVKDHEIFFASAPGAKLAGLASSPVAAFEVDGIANRLRWSVVAKGVAVRLHRDTEIEESGVLALHSLAPTEKWNYIRIVPTTITGRQFRSASNSSH